MIQDLDEAIDQLMTYAALSNSPEALAELYSTMEFTDLCVTRSSLTEIELTDEQQQAIATADSKLKAAFDADTLKLYADYFPTFPIHEWWG